MNRLTAKGKVKRLTFRIDFSGEGDGEVDGKVSALFLHLKKCVCYVKRLGGDTLMFNDRILNM